MRFKACLLGFWALLVTFRTQLGFLRHCQLSVCVSWCIPKVSFDDKWQVRPTVLHSGQSSGPKKNGTITMHTPTGSKTAERISPLQSPSNLAGRTALPRNRGATMPWTWSSFASLGALHSAETCLPPVSERHWFLASYVCRVRFGTDSVSTCSRCQRKRHCASECVSFSGSMKEWRGHWRDSHCT